MLAWENDMKKASRVCKQAERAYGKPTFPPAWAILLHDYCYVREDNLVADFTWLDQNNTGIVPETDFLAVLEELRARLPANQHLLDRKLLGPLRVENAKPKAIYYTLFLNGRTLLPVKFLMRSYETKVKRTKARKLPPSRDEPFPISLQPASAAAGGLVPRHRLVTDWSVYDRDHPPDHPIQDDSAWYMEPAEPQMIQLTTAVRQRDEHTIADALYNNPGTQVNMPDRYLRTPLMVATRMGDLNMVKWLVEAG